MLCRHLQCSPTGDGEDSVIASPAVRVRLRSSNFTTARSVDREGALRRFSLLQEILASGGLASER
jgi:hypothetical protein